MLEVSVKLFKPKGGVSSETTEIKPELAASPYAEEDSSTLQCGMLVISFLRAFSCCAVFVLHHPHSLLLGGKHQQEATCQKLVFPKKKISVRLCRDNFYFRCRRAVMLRAATQLAQKLFVFMTLSEGSQPAVAFPRSDQSDIFSGFCRLTGNLNLLLTHADLFSLSSLPFT